jgi:hypothetical protein
VKATPSSLSQAYSIRELADRLGLNRQNLQWKLRDVKPSGTRIVHGNEAAIWELTALPQPLLCRLDAIALQNGFASAEALLNAPVAAWPPPDFPKLEKVAQQEINRAEQWRAALMPSLLAPRESRLSAEFKARGLEDYGKTFGRAISERHWYSIFMRTIARDAGAQNWNSLALYLPNKPRLKDQPERSLAKSLSGQFAELDSYIAALSNSAAPTEIEILGIWTLALESYDRMMIQGTPAKRAARQVRSFLFARADFLASGRNALRMAFERRLAKWIESRHDAKALHDGRENNGAKLDFPDADRDLLTHRAVFHYRGDLAPAWRDCLRSGFSDATRERYAGKAASKSHVPARIADLVGPEVEILTVMHRGPRAFDAIKGHVTRSYDGIAALQCMQADDFTLNTYFYVPDGNGGHDLTRGQVILFIDFRTLRILGWALEPRKSYSSLTIRSLCTRVFAEFGVPEVLYFERGLWKNATLLTGKTNPLAFTEISQGLREFGIRFIHAIRPRSKTVERVGGLFQDISEAEPGYCGRDERRDAPESLRPQIAEVKSGKVHPSKHFYSLDDWHRRIGELVEQYNATPQQGRILAGLSPDEALEKYVDRTNPTMQFGAQLRYLLAHDKRPARVTLNGITIRIGKQEFNYRGREIAHLVGRDVIAWFDPENTGMLAVTDLNRQNPLCVRRSQEPSALEDVIDPDSGTLKNEMAGIEGQASYMKTRFRVLKANFPLPERQVLANTQTLALGQEIESRRSSLREKEASDRKRIKHINQQAGTLGASVPARPKRLEVVESGLEWEAQIRRQIKEGEESKA